jgi:hypothetical protein
MIFARDLAECCRAGRGLRRERVDFPHRNDADEAIMTKKQATAPSMYCRHCGYALVGLSQNRCPECGRPFDPSNPRTFLSRPKGWRVRQWLRRIAWGLLELAVASTIASAISLAVMIPVLHSRWKAQDRAIAAIRQAGGRVSIDSRWSLPLRVLFGCRTNRSFNPGPAGYRSGLLGWRFAYLNDAAAHVLLFNGQIGRGRPGEIVSDAWQDLPVDDAWLANLRNLPCVVSIMIASAEMTDAGLEHFQGMRSLQLLALRCPKVTQAAVDQLQQSLPRAQVKKLRQPPASAPASAPQSGGRMRED